MDTTIDTLEPTKVVVITGASSGIGELTSLTLAEQGYHLVLAARSKQALKRIADRCRSTGARVLGVITDVSSEADVAKLSERALHEFGRIDVWVNNAGTTHLGTFMETSPDDFRQVLETNFFGTVHGSRAALEQFYRQKAGTLINIASVLGLVPDPYESPYVASKFAVRGFTACLRQEAYLAGLGDIHICTVMPATMDTPIYKNAGNATGKSPLPIPPIYPAKMVAAAISRLIDSPRAETIVGKATLPLIDFHHIAPAAFEKVFARYIKALHFKNKSTPVTKGNLYGQSAMPQASGRWKGTVPAYFDVIVGATAAVGTLYGAYALLKRKRR